MKRCFWVILILTMAGFHVPAHAAQGAQDWVDILRDDDEATAQNAETMLVKMGPEAVKPLQKVLDDANFKVRRRAAETLGQLGPQAKRAAPDLVQRLLDPQFEVQAAAQKALLRIGDEAIGALSDALKNDNADLRQVALSALSQFGAKGVPIILDRLKKDDNAFIRSSAAQALGSAQPVTTEMVQSLIQALSDLEENVRGQAADSLGQWGTASREAVPPLFSVSRGDKDALVRRKAMDALIQVGISTPAAGVAVAEQFGSLFSNPDAAVRREAISGLEKLGMAGLPLLVRALSDQDSSVSDEAGNAIVRMGPEAVPALEPLQNSTFPYLKRKADELIKRMTQNKTREHRT